jgi:fructosamine-3-kinase
VPSLSERIEDSLGLELAGIRVVGGQHGYQHVTGTLADGRSIFAKVAAGAGAAGAAAFAAEANGLRWLAEADGGPPVPQVIGVADDFLVIELLKPLDQASTPAARRFGADLARMHAAGAPPLARHGPGI